MIPEIFIEFYIYVVFYIKKYYTASVHVISTIYSFRNFNENGIKKILLVIVFSVGADIKKPYY